MVEPLDYTQSLQQRSFYPDEHIAFVIDMSNYEALYQRKKVQLSVAKDEKSLQLIHSLLNKFSIRFEPFFDPTYSMIDKLFQEIVI